MRFFHCIFIYLVLLLTKKVRVGEYHSFYQNDLVTNCAYILCTNVWIFQARFQDVQNGSGSGDHTRTMLVSSQMFKCKISSTQACPFSPHQAMDDTIVRHQVLQCSISTIGDGTVWVHSEQLIQGLQVLVKVQQTMRGKRFTFDWCEICFCVDRHGHRN